MNDKIKLIQGDITTLKVDAIVNAANSALSDGSGVNGAIQRAAGPELLKECSQLGGCPTGSAKITQGYNLPARFVIHAVGPVWQGGQHDEAKLLASCYQTSLELSVKHGIKTIAFPAISCGIFGYPVGQAVKIAVTTVDEFLKKHPEIEIVYFVCFDQEIYCSYQEVLRRREFE